MYIAIYAAGPGGAEPSFSPPDGKCSVVAAGSHAARIARCMLASCTSLPSS